MKPYRHPDARFSGALYTLLLFTALLFTSVRLFDPEPLFAQSLQSETFKNGVVVSADKLGSEVGLEILKQGGNAVDAAVGVQFALAVTLPRAGNLGGGGFMVYHDKDGKVYTLDFREKAPAAASRDMYLDGNKEVREGESLLGHKAAGVPGTVDGMIRALERFGRLPLETVLEPAIRLAREGYILSYSQAESMNYAAGDFAKFQGSSETFLHPDGRAWQRGDLFIQEDLARTLERVAKFGRDGFYAGETAALIVEEMKRGNGIITAKDLAEYRSSWREPIHTEFMGYDFWMMGPPSSGGIALAQMLQMLDQLNPEALADSDPQSAKMAHIYAEIMTRAFADRAYHLGDPDYYPVPLEELLSPEYNASRIANFNPRRHLPSSEFEHGDFIPIQESTETTHFSIVDTEGNAVAINTTLNGSFGNKVVVSGAGFFLNNEMDDFSIKPGTPNMYGLVGAEANAIEPGKRMLSSMTPIVVTKDGKPVLVNGGSGGPTIITAVFQSTINALLFKMNAQEAISAPRVHHQWKPDVLIVEKYGHSPDTRALLESYGHTLVQRGALARVHMIVVDENGLMHGAPDTRGDGFTAGY